MQRKKLYRINEEPFFVNPTDDKPHDLFVLERDFTVEELRWPMWNTGKTDISVNINAKNSFLNKQVNKKRNQLLTDLTTQIDKEIELILSVYPKNIRLSFPAKENEAELYSKNLVTNPSVEIPIIYTEACTFFNTQTPTDTQLNDIVTRIQANSIVFKQLAGKAQAILSKFVAIINNPQTDVLNYTLPSVLLN